MQDRQLAARPVVGLLISRFSERPSKTKTITKPKKIKTKQQITKTKRKQNKKVDMKQTPYINC